MKKTVMLTTSLFLFSVTISFWIIGSPELQLVYASPYKDIDVATAYDMIVNGSYPNLVILDVRTQGEYDGGHIRGAVLIPNTELDARIEELTGNENHEIVVYCRSGARSVAASVILDSHNFTMVYNTVGGILAWQDAGYPLWISENEKTHSWTQWRFWAIVVAGMMLLAVTVYFLKKRTPPKLDTPFQNPEPFNMTFFFANGRHNYPETWTMRNVSLEPKRMYRVHQECLYLAL